MTEIPRSCDVLVIGGGPAGSSAATHLAQSGIDVVLLERAVFPRNQVGESLIPHIWKYTDMTGVSEKIEREGFLAKAGGITVWDDKIHQILFSDFGYTRPGLHVERDIFDDILLKHAESCGASVFNEVAVRDIDFGDSRWPQAFYTDKRGHGNHDGAIRCQYIIDASGHSSFLANQFKSRQTISSQLNFLALWGYFHNSRFVGVDRCSHAEQDLTNVKPVTLVMSFEGGWLWHIVLRGKTSVGLIVPTDRTRGMDRRQREVFFKQTCASLPYLSQLLEPASFIEGSLQFRPDYSYYSTNVCGENYYCIGDSGAFVDPIFSHGVQNALYNAAAATLAIKESLKNSKQRLRYSQLCESRMQQFYGFSRALSLGDFGSNGVNPGLVKNLMKSLPPLELELILVASEMTNRSDNFRRLAREAGVLGQFEENFSGRTSVAIEALNF
ncbi:NAD(P)/FAD-dependent oxidoreductase [Methylomarinum sp. Ch1-1]|uniref:NAD(P)/FAD-dependent oxidoreductase n=1 Tax=Methylomarinum roseum TaxID=3067653 RepID=A0AAU7NXG5_9GAMM|nr:NAD(P)/FAD-dependent oxidoreductase [Methylomarinum sp. Ch1-1]MDP4522298.1 NAD(P)/FAD-dependent oxidoreductase [Methylomarinum sp. Ch1-1]